MTERKNVLVFPAGTEIAFEIHDALKNRKNVLYNVGNNLYININKKSRIS